MEELGELESTGSLVVSIPLANLKLRFKQLSKSPDTGKILLPNSESRAKTAALQKQAKRIEGLQLELLRQSFDEADDVKAELKIATQQLDGLALRLNKLVSGPLSQLTSNYYQVIKTLGVPPPTNLEIVLETKEGCSNSLEMLEWILQFLIECNIDERLESWSNESNTELETVTTPKSIVGKEVPTEIEDDEVVVEENDARQPEPIQYVPDRMKDEPLQLQPLVSTNKAKHGIDPKSNRACICGQTFSRQDSVRIHVNHFASDSLTKFHCQLCPSQFRWLKNLAWHAKKVHRKVIYYCTTCELRFPTQSELADHRHMVHAANDFEVDKLKERKLSPAPIPKTAPKSRSASSTNVHREDAKSKGPSCICGRQFATRQSLTRHIQRRIPDADKMFKCNTCAKRFTFRRDCRQHMRKTHGQQLPKSIEVGCSLCGSLFSSSAECTIHWLEVHKFSRTNQAFKTQERVDQGSDKRKKLDVSQTRESMSEVTQKHHGTGVGGSSVTQRGPTQRLGQLHGFDMMKAGFNCKCGSSYEDRESLRHHLAVHA